ncbi:DNA/RNA polymerases superfamily protein [Gossypium australe]|uniref:DNA/RNA polymerases superfamily protein n=1 Tax=Gossypium australe TaxID=47621 RepID=A0A5B6WRN6_9ROSI|nr:DNA/RNA polymerases superfamily protein [Gossypium australe]
MNSTVCEAMEASAIMIGTVCAIPPWHTGVPGGRVTKSVASVISHDQATRACLVAVWTSQYVFLVLAQPDRTATPLNPRPARVTDLIRLNKPPVHKIRKNGAEEFLATADDDVEKAEFWLENTIEVFDELSVLLINV